MLQTMSSQHQVLELKKKQKSFELCKAHMFSQRLHICFTMRLDSVDNK